MSPLQLLVSVLAAAAAASAAPVSTSKSLSRVCALIYSDSEPTFDRYSISGNTKCSCESETTASCERLNTYPTVAPNSPDALLAQYHQPSSSTALQALLAYQIQLTCGALKTRGRRCELTWPSDGSGTPVCDCASADGRVEIRRPYYIDSVRSRSSISHEEEKDGGQNSNGVGENKN